MILYFRNPNCSIGKGCSCQNDKSHQSAMHFRFTHTEYVIFEFLNNDIDYYILLRESHFLSFEFAEVLKILFGNR